LGEYDREVTLADVRALGAHCREFIYRGHASTDAAEIAAALSSAHALAGASAAHGSVGQVGAFVMLSSSHLREATSHEEFHFVNKTPPAAAESCTHHIASRTWRVATGTKVCQLCRFSLCCRRVERVPFRKRAHMRVDKDISQVKTHYKSLNKQQTRDNKRQEETTYRKPIECALETSSGGSGGDWT
jgi:hypothetical protein